MKKVLALVLLLCSPSLGCADGFRFYGDLLLARGIETFVAEQGEAPVRQALAPFLSRDALQVVNLEGAVGAAAGCADGNPLCFATKPVRLDLLRGFDVVSLENNHALDLGPTGLRETMGELRKRNIVPLGGKNYSVIIATTEGNLGIVAVTDVVNAPVDRLAVTLADSPEVLQEIRRLKERTTAVVVYVHWGRELLSVATGRMQRLAEQYVAAGADVVVGTHPHVPGTVACVAGKPVIWSLGNFLFDQKYTETKQGAVLDCAIGDNDKLKCTLVGHATPRASYLPQALADDPYRVENIALSACTPEVEPTWNGAFSKGKREESLVLKREGATNGMSSLELSDLTTGKRTARTPLMPIRKVQPVDLNGDGIQEIMLLQDIYSSFDGETAKRVYLYSMDGGFHALWRGSALSRPLLDATFAEDHDGKPVLVALHSADSFLARNLDCAARTVMFYRWNGFGFSGIKEIPGADNSDSVVSVKGTLRLLQQGRVMREIPVEAMDDGHSKGYQ